MEKFTKLKYSELTTKRIDEYETSFIIQPLERGFANTLGNTLRRVLIASIPGVAPFAIKINGISHEFQTISNLTEDVVQLILNIKNVKFSINESMFKDGEIIKVSLKNKEEKIYAKSFSLPSGVEIINVDEYIATSSKIGVLDFELFLIKGRGFRTFEENKDFIKTIQSQIETKISNGALIAIDSNFSPIINVSYSSTELNSSTAIIEEKLTLNIKTDGTLEAKDALAIASRILIGHLTPMSDISNLEKEEIFQEIKIAKQSNVLDIPISSMELSVRSYNCLKRAGYESIQDIAKLSIKELENIKQLGKKSAEEIIEKLKEHNISLEEGDE